LHIRIRAARPHVLCRGTAAGIIPLMAVLLELALTVSPVPAFAGHARTPRAGAAKVDAVVAKLRDLPLPLRAFQLGIASTKLAPQPLPALESRRQQVYDELHALGPASVPALARALRDPDPQMRRDVAVALDVLGGGWWHFPDGDSKVDIRPALPALLAALQDSDAGVRAWAAQDISAMGAAASAAVPQLRVMLHSPDPGSRGSACNALGAIGSAARGALPDLRSALSDPSPEVRQSAGAAIASIDRAEALN
jgi:HEAT repeat protein